MSLSITIPEITLDINDAVSQSLIVAHQGDTKTRYVKIKLIQNGTQITLDSSTMQAIIKASNGGTVKAVNNCTIADNKVTAELTAVMLDTPGTLDCEISIIEDDKCITSALFAVYVQQSAASDESQITASAEYGALTAALTSISDVAEKAELVQGIVDDIAEIESAENLIEQVEEIKAFVDQDCLRIAYVAKGELDAVRSGNTLTVTWESSVRIYSPYERTFYTLTNNSATADVSSTAKLLCLNKTNAQIEFVTYSSSVLENKNYELIDVFYGTDFARISPNVKYKNIRLDECYINRGHLTAEYTDGTLSFTASSDLQIYSPQTKNFYSGIGAITAVEVGNVAKLICFSSSTNSIAVKSFSDTDLNWGNYELIDIFHSGQFAGISSRIIYNDVSFKHGGIISGPVFVFVSNNKVNLICETNARAYYGSNIMNISSWGKSINIPGTGTYAVCLNASEFYLKSVTQLAIDEVVIAIVYSNTVFAVDPNIFVNTIPITGLVQRDGVPFVMNNHRILGYDAEPVVTGSYIDDFGYFYKFKDVWKRNAACIGYKDKQGRILTNSNAVIKNEVDIDGKTILCIGDSVTKRGWFQDRIKTYAPNVNFIGTQNTYYSTAPCEGYSGRTAQNVLNSSTIVLNDNVTTIPNPFWNTTTNEIDFSYYCSTQNVSPDYVILEFGLNETNEINYAAAMRRFIQSIKDYDSDIKIYVVQPFNAVRDIGAANVTNGKQRDACDRCVLESYTFPDCTLIPAWYIMVDEYDYPIAAKQYGYGNVTIQQATDGVHPSETVGFAKLGDFIYNYLGKSIASPSASENNIN